MAMLKLMMPVALLLAINLHSTDGQTCTLLNTLPSATANTPYGVMGSAGQTCTLACQACGAQPAAGADASVVGLNGGLGRFSPAVVQNIGIDICPTITYATTEAGGVNDNLAGIGIGAPTAVQTAPGMLVSTTGRPLTVASGHADATSYPLNGYGVQSALVSSGIHGMPDAGGAAIALPIDLATASPQTGTICRCLLDAGATFNRATCPTCSCSNLGIPTSAPTALPTSAPTAVSSAPVSSTITSSSDDSLSGGAIAGIVIGSVVGAALVIGAGVMIGSK